MIQSYYLHPRHTFTLSISINTSAHSRVHAARPVRYPTGEELKYNKYGIINKLIHNEQIKYGRIRFT